MKGKFSAIYLLPLLLFVSNLFGQTITGKVLNESGAPAGSVSVKLMGSAKTVITNEAGHFSLAAAKLPDTLVFSAIGYETYKVRITEKTLADTRFEVVLLQSRTALHEVVVAGYGRSKKREVTGSVSSTRDVDKDVAYEGYIAGHVPGVSVTSDYAKSAPVEAKSIRIRGTSSIAAGGGALEKQFLAGKKVRFADSATTTEDGKVYRTKLVTAGEVNDFNKWTMWEDYTDNEFKQWSQKWKLSPNQRYCIQLQNKNNVPVIGQKVWLKRKDNNVVVWNATTDNTGKAELWAGMNAIGAANDTEYYIEVGNNKKIQRPTIFTNGINKMELDIPCNISNTVDIAFVVDATGSMGDEIEFLKLELEDVLRKTFDRFSDLDLRAASVFYRDKGDEYIAKHTGFNSDLLKTLNFIKLQKAGGGGDTPEAVESALQTALDSLEWSAGARARLMFLILDAPPHDGTENELYTLIEKAASKGIRVIPIVCSGADKSTEFLMRSLALATNGTYVFLTDDSGVGGKHIKPTTDAFNVELLNNLLQRLIGQSIYAEACNPSGQKVVAPVIKIPENILKVNISPNPTSGRFVIRSNKPLKEIFIADFTGKLLVRLSTTSKQDKWEGDLTQYPSGTYIVKYITTENVWGAEKIIVVR